MDFDFGDKPSLDDVPTKYQGLYVATDDPDGGEQVYTLAETAKGLVADYMGTQKSLAAVKNDKKIASDESAKRRQALKSFDDLAERLSIDVGDDGVAAAIEHLIGDLQSRVANGQEIKVNMDKMRAEFQKRMEEAVAAKDTEIAERDKALSMYLIGERASVALTKAKAKSPELLMPHVKERTKVVRDEQGNYSVRVLDPQGDFRTDSTGGWMSVDGLVQEMKSDPVFSPAFESEAPAGTGSVPGAMRTTMQRPAQENLSPTQKIRAGLDSQFGRR